MPVSYKRVILKLSGEALGVDGTGFCHEKFEDAARMLELLFDTITYEIGGNYFGFEAGATDLFYVIPRKAVEGGMTSIASISKSNEAVTKKVLSIFYQKLDTVENQ